MNFSKVQYSFTNRTHEQQIIIFDIDQWKIPNYNRRLSVENYGDSDKIFDWLTVVPTILRTVTQCSTWVQTQM